MDLKEIFQQEFNEGLVHQAVVAYMAGQRSGTKAQKTRSDVRGGGIKPWRQKGTGRARAGTIRSPIWRSGGVTFAARPRDFSKKMNKKMHLSAMRSIFAELARKEAVIIIDELGVAEPQTKLMVAKLAEIAQTSNVLIVTEADDINAILAARNIPHCDVVSIAGINPLNLISHEKVIMTKGALEKVQEWLS